MKKIFYDHYRFSGSHREVGRQYGEALEKQIREHLERIVQDAADMSGVGRQEALGYAGMFETYIKKYAPGFQEELRGLAEGAGLTYEEALLLQVRQEVTHSRRFGLHPLECSCFAVSQEYTADGKVYSGQNADLIGDFESMVNLVTMEVTGKPRILMVLPAGQLSHSGMNSEGISVNCNFLNSEGWGRGFPRYLMSRLALEQTTFEDACRSVEIPERSSQRNLLICDRHGHMRDYELTHQAAAKLDGSGFMVHTNHFLAETLQQYSAATPWEQADSEIRLRRLTERITTWKGQITPSLLKTFLADHQDGEHSVCVHASEQNPYHTYVSMINHLEEGCMEVARGNPCQNPFASYTV